MNAHIIQTHYDGHYFRSRLEARWAVFFHEMDIPYHYEPEGFSFEGEGYLPDFFLPDLDCYVEIKPAAPTDEETRKARQLAECTGKRVFVFYGPPKPPVSEADSTYSESAELFEGSQRWDSGYWWCQCPVCSKCDIQFNGRADRIRCSRSDCAAHKSGHGDKGYNASTERLLQAYAKATSARF